MHSSIFEWNKRVRTRYSFHINFSTNINHPTIIRRIYDWFQISNLFIVHSSPHQTRIRHIANLHMIELCEHLKKKNHFRAKNKKQIYVCTLKLIALKTSNTRVLCENSICMVCDTPTHIVQKKNTVYEFCFCYRMVLCDEYVLCFP